MYTSIPQSGSPFPASVQDPGLHVWRVEKLKPVPVARENQGIFFSGDSYLVLHNGPEELSHLHLWIGQQSSRDEQGACAVLAVHLNTLLGERPVQHREAQGNESDLFMSYFPRGLKYQEGGVESAFHKTSPGATPAAVRKLYQVKGKKNIRATERALSWDSFNTGDCFILDLGQNIFAWCGGKSNILERNKARDLALAIRDSERQGKAQVEIISDGEEPAEMIQVLGPKPALKEGNPEEDLTADRTNAQAAALYKVSDATGQMNLTKVADSSPFALELLIPDDCFVLDNGLCGKIYIWKGRKANEKERQAALQVAEDFISRMRYAPKHSGGDSAPGPRESHLQAILQRLEVRVGSPCAHLLLACSSSSCLVSAQVPLLVFNKRVKCFPHSACTACPGVILPAPPAHLGSFPCWGGVGHRCHSEGPELALRDYGRGVRESWWAWQVLL